MAKNAQVSARMVRTVCALLTINSAAGFAARRAAPLRSALSMAYSSSAAARRTDILFQADKRPVILFDGVCNFCNANVNLALDWDPEGRFRFASLQSEVGKALLQRCGRAPTDLSSIVVVEEGRMFTKSEAVLRIAETLPGALPGLNVAASAAKFTVPSFLRDAVYDTVANNRYRVMGKRNQCRVGDADFSSRFIPDTALDA